jgi:hypothetical protein
MNMMKVTVSERFADPPICLYDPESRVCFVPGRLVELDERELTVLQKTWLDQGALTVVENERVPACGDVVPNFAELAYADLYRQAKEAGLRYSVLPKKTRLIEDLAAAQKAAGVLTRPEGVGNG